MTTTDAVWGAFDLPPGLYNSTIRNCVIGNNVRISNCELLENTFIQTNSGISNCGIITKPQETKNPFGNGNEIPVVIGTGGREVVAFAELELEEACQIAANRGDEALQNKYLNRVDDYLNKITFPYNVVCENVCVESVSAMENVFLGPYCTIRGSQVINCTVLSTKEEKSSISGGSDVRDSLLQWACDVDSQSIVSNSLMCTRSHAERHGKLLDSILGPYSGVAEGEISESLVGPFVGFHHQALLIASFWPAGRGNVGYGANVGSNHTGKAPDQELWHGEGVFYGLGSCVKFPSNFTEAPYTLIATGVTTLPQRVTMPFSLISAPTRTVPSVSPAYNQIHPGWLLSQNYYSTLRNERKFRDRGSKSKRVSIEFRILKPSTIHLMRIARDQLASLQDIPNDKFYTDKDLSGLGKNIMSNAARKDAVQTYTYFMVYYAINYLWESKISKSQDWKDILRNNTPSYTDYALFSNYSYTGTRPMSQKEKEMEWQLVCTIIKLEAPKIIPNLENDKQVIIPTLLLWLIDAKKQIVKMAAKSKQKDEKRGDKIIPGYIDAHGTVHENDKLIKLSLQDIEKEEKEIKSKLAQFSQSRI